MQVEDAAKALGLKTNRVESIREVEAALAEGFLVVLAGNPAAYNTGIPRDQYDGFSGGHFILVTGKDKGRFLVNDPLSHVGTLSVDATQLEQYMAFRNWNIGIAVKG